MSRSDFSGVTTSPSLLARSDHFVVRNSTSVVPSCLIARLLTPRILGWTSQQRVRTQFRTMTNPFATTYCWSYCTRSMKKLLEKKSLATTLSNSCSDLMRWSANLARAIWFKWLSMISLLMCSLLCRTFYHSSVSMSFWLISGTRV